MTIQTCYMCEKQATTQEHAPPKCLFPTSTDIPNGKDFRKHLITVPSCTEHNCANSHDDEYFLYILSMSFTSNDVGMSQFMTKVKRAMARRPHIANKLVKSATPVKIHDTETDQWHQALALNIEASRIDTVLKKCAIALYFHETKRKFQGDAQAISAFLLSPQDIKLNESIADAFEGAEALLAGHPAKGKNPEIFSYKLIAHEKSAIVYMEFYENSKSIVRLNGHSQG